MGHRRSDIEMQLCTKVADSAFTCLSNLLMDMGRGFLGGGKLAALMTLPLLGTRRAMLGAARKTTGYDVRDAAPISAPTPLHCSVLIGTSFILCSVRLRTGCASQWIAGRCAQIAMLAALLRGGIRSTSQRYQLADC
jgi:hypothetical protein